MLRKTLLMLALAPAPTLAAQQPTQQPASAHAKAVTTKAKAHHRRAAHKAKAATAASRDTTKAKP